METSQLVRQALCAAYLHLADLYSQLQIARTDKERRSIQQEIWAAKDYVKALHSAEN
ncbi:hypothetical protein GNE08_26175 [Trichormus variabilis ARAD]|uniref:Uncharacterized protein n=1 Tax=Trichormus variabilis N2B TaxID=2681315 RepID=A0ABR6S4K0_ANAVA|nr:MULTISPECIES: hypothetical protein [Nostocaceae]MBC1217686.1 hypothetical protein [Trichormus variabilis ARAD]MBC1259016.1 hypothetical protein [Trichormus variabilis V5]MBC1269217.1 hypothetical protein [Trichormus variabilis FSR]MBC1301272.1 hypothetical protein [Trichormus variabilis N2B]MBC1309786.1 hypothetical protein [Trichormus variabilis PNB]